MLLWNLGLQESSEHLFPTTADVENAGGTNDLINVVVVDETGEWTELPKTVLESFEGLSKATNVKFSERITSLLT